MRQDNWALLTLAMVAGLAGCASTPPPPPPVVIVPPPPPPPPAPVFEKVSFSNEDFAPQAAAKAAVGICARALATGQSVESIANSMGLQTAYTPSTLAKYIAAGTQVFPIPARDGRVVVVQGADTQLCQVIVGHAPLPVARDLLVRELMQRQKPWTETGRQTLAGASEQVTLTQGALSIDLVHIYPATTADAPVIQMVIKRIQTPVG